MRHAGRILMIGLAATVIGTLTLACFYVRTRHDIHITLDVRHIQETATSIEDVVSGEAPLDELEPGGDGSLLTRPRRAWLARLIDPATTAHAQAAPAKPKYTPEMEKAILDRRRRFKDVRAYKDAGALGENNIGLMEKRPAPLLQDPVKDADVRALIKAENRDRRVIYDGVAKQNNATRPEQLAEVQRAWSEIHRRDSKPGDWIQVPTVTRDYKKFLRSKMGRLFKAKPQPAQWLQVPKGYVPPKRAKPTPKPKPAAP